MGAGVPAALGHGQSQRLRRRPTSTIPPTLYNLSFGGRLSIRIARGLEWNIGGDISRIRDQIYIPLEELSDEDILLGRRQLPTNSKLSINTGFSFTFGSIYNNVVNNRFGFTGGGMPGGGGEGWFF